MKYNKTNYPNIFWYETTKGKRYHIRRGYYLNGKKKEANKSGLKSIVEARAALAEIERQIAENEFDTNKNLTCDQYWEIYCENRINTGRWSPDTIYVKELNYQRHFRERYGKMKLVDVDRWDYSNFISEYLKIYSRHTVKQLHGLFNAMFNDALRNKFIKDNPIDGIYIGESTIAKKNKKLHLSDFKKVDETARNLFDDYEYTIFRMTYFGYRQSEVNGIKLGSLKKRPDGRYEVYADDSRTLKKPEGNQGMKTKSSERTTVLDLLTSDYLDKAIKQTHAIAKKYGRILGPSDYLFVVDYYHARKSSLGKPIPVNRIKRLFEKVRQACGIHVTPHMMRHFFATQGVIAGVPIEHMAAALGHSTSYMTEKYTHIQNEVSESVTDSFMKAIK